MNGRIALIVAFTVLPFLALAQAPPDRSHGGENVIHGYAQVLRADPIYETVRTRVPEQRCDSGCRIVQVERSERRVTAYDVEYRYMGETYMSRMTYDPGSRLRLRISVMPDDDRPPAYR